MWHSGQERFKWNVLNSETLMLLLGGGGGSHIWNLSLVRLIFIRGFCKHQGWKQNLTLKRPLCSVIRNKPVYDENRWLSTDFSWEFRTAATWQAAVGVTPPTFAPKLRSMCVNMRCEWEAVQLPHSLNSCIYCPELVYCCLDALCHSGRVILIVHLCIWDTLLLFCAAKSVSSDCNS